MVTVVLDAIADSGLLSYSPVDTAYATVWASANGNTFTEYLYVGQLYSSGLA